MATYSSKRGSGVLALFFLAGALLTPGAPAGAAGSSPMDGGWGGGKKGGFVITYDNEGKLDLGIGVVRDGISHPIWFTLEELAWFWKHQRHQQFIVVVLEKWNSTDQERTALAKRLTDYFFTAGFRRVLIRQ